MLGLSLDYGVVHLETEKTCIKSKVQRNGYILSKIRMGDGEPSIKASIELF